MTDTTLTARLVEKVLATRYEALPAEAVELSKQIVLDGLAVMHAGSTEPLGVGRISTAYVREMGGQPQASVIAGGFKTSVSNAAYANGCMAHALDFDNTHYPPNHPTSPTLPAILALAEHHRLSGRSIIEAIVAAYEVQGRLRIAATGLKTGQGFHKPGTVGLFGAVTAAVKLLALDQREALMAFGIAGSRAGSMAANTGTMTKSSHSGHGARMGVECAKLAKMGWTASADIFGPKGFFETFVPGDAEPELLVKDFGEPLRMLDPGVGFKLYPCNGFTQRPIDAALALREEHSIRAQDIARVEVTHPRFDYVNRPQPRSGLDGKFSVQYTTLAALLDGEVTVRTFADARLFAPDIAALLPQVHFVADDSIPLDKAKLHIVVKVWLKDGREVSKKIDNKVVGWLGSKGNPPTREQRLKKFFACTREVLRESESERMLALAERLETLTDPVEIMDIARCERAAS